MAITPLPTPPSRSQSPATFSTDADAFLGALPDFATEANALAADVNADEASAAASATTASNAASVAVGAANYQGDYNAGTTYQIGESVSYSGRRYVAKTINTGVTPVDGANWFLINDGDVLGPVSATNNALALYDGTTGKIIKNGPAPGTAGNIIVSNGTTWASQAFPPVAGSISANAANNVTIRQPLIVQSDGTVTPVTGSGPSISGEFPFSAANTQFHDIAYNPTEDRYLIVYIPSSSYNLTCVVAQVTGTTVTYGTPVTLHGFSLAPSVTYNQNQNRFVVGFFAYIDNVMRVIAVSVSGLVPTAGTSVAFSGTSAGGTSVASNPSSSAVAIAWGSGTTLNVAEFTLSGSTITFPSGSFSTGKAINTTQFSEIKTVSIAYCGTAPYGNSWAVAYINSSGAGQLFIGSMSSGQFNTWTSEVNLPALYQEPKVLWDSAIARLVVAGRERIHTTTVANPPALSVSAAYNGSASPIYPVSMYRNSNTNGYSIVFRNSGANNFLQVADVTVTASAITQPTAVRTISTDSTETVAAAFSTVLNRGVAVWRNTSQVKTAIINSATVTNLTATNFVGFAGATVTAGQSVSVQTIGSSVAGFSGFTPATPYYVRIDGTLATTPDPFFASPVYAGLALSASSLLVKG